MTDDTIFRGGPRVTLRPLKEEDAPRLTKWINNPKVTQFVKAHLPTMEVEEREWIKSLISRKATNIIVMLEVEGVSIGTMGIHAIDYRHGTATTGALIGEPDYWGKGYGSEAKMLLLEYAFNTLNLRKINSEVIAFNKRSAQYSIKCGYQIEGRKRLEHYAKGEYWDVIQLAVFRDEWQPFWDAFYEEHGDSLIF